MSTRAPKRREVIDPHPFIRAKESHRNDQKALTDSANDHFFATPPKDERVDPLWMITAAGLLLFVFLAIAVALG